MEPSARLLERVHRGTRHAIAGKVATTMAIALAIGVFAVSPAAAQASASWTLACTGNGAGGVAWQWLQNGAAITGASGAASCSDSILSGTIARPANANGIQVTIGASAGSNSHSKIGTKSFGTGSSFKMQLSATASESTWITVCIDRTCTTTHVNIHEKVDFSLLA